jgi:type IV secretion system protein VirB8
MNTPSRRLAAPPEAFQARPVTSDPALLNAYFAQVASYEADRLRAAQRTAKAGFAVGAVGALIGLLGIGAVAGLTPMKTVIPLVFRVNDTTGIVERVYDIKGGAMEVTEASQRYFLWQYVRLRQNYTQAEARSNFEAVTLMSSPTVQNEYAAHYRGSNPGSPQVVLGPSGSASLRWVSTSFLGPKLAQVRFVQVERKGDSALPQKHMVATIGFDFVPGDVSASAMNINPLGFIVTSYRADAEVAQ